MLKSQFEKLLAQIDVLIKQCEECKISSSAEFDSLTINELRAKIAKAQEAQANMDKVLQIELYHIIGMGNLNAAQEVQLCAKIREYSSHRSYIKAICSYALPATPKIPTKADYNCKVLKINLNKNLKS